MIKYTIVIMNRYTICPNIHTKCAISALRQFLATESPFKVIKNSFYFTSKALLVPKIFKFLSCLFGHVSKRLD